MISGQKHVPEPNEIEALHQRYQQQAGWTASIQKHLLAQLTLPNHPHVLEVGCGTGVIIHELNTLLPNSCCYGIDIERDVLELANEATTSCGYAQANAFRLPFENNTFDLLFCHFFLLWASPLDGILREIKRVLKPTSPFIAFAEPDYGSRIDHPEKLSRLGQLQEQSLKQQGACTTIGRELPQLLTRTGFCEIQYGILGGEWQVKPQFNEEKITLLRDLAYLPDTDKKELEDLLTIDQAARANGTRILFVPTFYALGFKKSSCN